MACVPRRGAINIVSVCKFASKESVGIGLALAKTIIDNQGGSIEVTSEENVGTEFIIKFNKMVV